VVEEGYEFFARRQLVTIFSAPNYCGEFDNAGAMMSVDDTLMCSFQVTTASVLHKAKVWHGRGGNVLGPAWLACTFSLGLRACMLGKMDVQPRTPCVSHVEFSLSLCVPFPRSALAHTACVDPEASREEAEVPVRYEPAASHTTACIGQRAL